MITAKDVQKALRTEADAVRAKTFVGFFKTGKGQYGEGDRFLGVTVPLQRRIARQFKDLSLPEISKLIQSPWHEDRLTALLILVGQFPRATSKDQEIMARFYLKHSKWVNNWDLVDSSAAYILGVHLRDRDKGILLKLARSKRLWERRMAIIATHAEIKQGRFEWTLKLAKLLLSDPHDLMHKAVGWMLREVGNRDIVVERKFLDRYATQMPRTMLRYAIEKFPEKVRKSYLALK